jgi:hypothetical protein
VCDCEPGGHTLCATAVYKTVAVAPTYRMCGGTVFVVLLVQMACTFSQLQGLSDGYQASGQVCSPALSFDDILIVNAQVGACRCCCRCRC